MSEDIVRKAAGDVEPQVAQSPIPLSDLLGTICQAVHAEVSMVVALLVSQQQPTSVLDPCPYRCLSRPQQVLVTLYLC